MLLEQKLHDNHNQKEKIIKRKIQLITKITQSTSTQASQYPVSNAISRRVSSIQSTSREIYNKRFIHAASEEMGLYQSQRNSFYTLQDKGSLKKAHFLQKYQSFMILKSTLRLQRIILKKYFRQYHENILLKRQETQKKQAKPRLKTQKSFSVNNIPIEQIKNTSNKDIDLQSPQEQSEYSSQSSFSEDSDIESLDINLQSNIKTKNQNKRLSRTQQGEEVTISKQFLMQQTGTLNSLINQAFKAPEKFIERKRKAHTKTNIQHEEDTSIVKDENQNKFSSIVFFFVFIFNKNIKLVVNPSLLQALKKDKNKYDSILKFQLESSSKKKQNIYQGSFNEQNIYNPVLAPLEINPESKIDQFTILYLSILIFICALRIYSLSLEEILFLA